MNLRFDNQPGNMSIMMPSEINDSNASDIAHEIKTMLRKHTPSNITIDFSETISISGNSYKLINIIRQTAKQYGGVVSLYNMASNIQNYLLLNNVKII